MTLFEDELFCSTCGSVFYIIQGCRECSTARMMKYNRQKTAERRAKGEKIHSHSLRAKKAQYTRILNLLLSGDEDKVEKGICMAENLKKKSVARYNHLKKLYKERTV